MNVSQLFDADAPFPSEPTTPTSPVQPSAGPLRRPAPAPEDSAHFSLRHLAEVATGPNAPKAEPLPPSRSGVIDLSAVRAAIRSAPTELLASPMMDPTGRLLPQTSTPTPPPTVRVGWLYGAIGVLAGVLVMLGVAMAWTPDQVASREPTTSYGGELALAEANWSHAEGDTLAPVIPRVKQAPTAAHAPDRTEPELVASTVAKTPRSSRNRSRPRVAAAKPTPASPPKSTPKPKSKAKRSDLSVDCILDPASCDRGSKPNPSTRPSTETAADALPSKLSSSQMKAALAKAKQQARTCRGMHGAAAGTKVSVRLSIDGKTGNVRSATPMAPHTGALGRCVSTKLARATFPRFSNAAMGVVYSVRM